MTTTQGERTDCLDRPEFALLEVLPYVLLAIATVLAVGIDSGNSTKLIAISPGRPSRRCGCCGSSPCIVAGATAGG